MFEITVRRPDGTVETVPKEGAMNDYLFGQAKKATHEAGRGECLSYRNIIPEVPAAEREYDEIMDLFDVAEAQYRRDARDEFENCGPAASMKAQARHRLDKWRAKYPREQALKIAEAWGGAAHDVKATAGDRAAQRIKAGEDHAQVLADMKAEWSAWTAQHVD
jgi:hypothetical protein